MSDLVTMAIGSGVVTVLALALVVGVAIRVRGEDGRDWCDGEPTVPVDPDAVKAEQDARTAGLAGKQINYARQGGTS